MLNYDHTTELDTPYTRNIAALWHSSPRLAQQIDNVPDELLINCQTTRNGQYTCQLTGTNGNKLYLHSRYDPDKEADIWAQGALDMSEKQQQANEGRMPMCYVVSGFGLGYHIMALRKKLLGDTIIIVIEKNLALLRTALALHDMSDMLRENKIVFLTRSDREEIFKRLGDISVLLTMGIVFTKSLHNIDNSFQTEVTKAINEFVSYLRSHTISMLANSITTCTNIANNLGAYVECGPINTLRNRFKQYPAIIVSAGPSLQKNIDYIKQIRDKVVVIAVQTTLRPLLAKGIKPDFVTSLDYHEVSKRFYDGLQDQLSDIHLIAEPKVSWHVIDTYLGHGPISILGNEFANLLLSDEPVNHDNIPAGATVAHLAFYLAQYMGNDPIILIGQDLGYTNNVYYSPGNAVHDIWAPELNRFYSLEMKEWERILRSRNMLRKTCDTNGTPIYTDEQMFTYLQQFEKDFAESAARVIDATEGGVHKQFTQAMTLKQAADLFCTTSIDQSKFAYRNDISTCNSQAAQKALEQLKKRKAEIEELADISDRTVKLVNTMLDNIDDQNFVNKQMIALDELRTMVRHREKTYSLVKMVSQMAEYYRFKADRILEAKGTTGIDRQKYQLQRDIGYVSEIRKGCNTAIDIISGAIDRLQTGSD
ncbi:MAG: motility associated factor glycosyltransferase family protein [Sedimentisphaerales bacterium]|nr:motility associated factor glycosyltransferase family protein [Sedimentisphaerales bacterium]MBN2841476.1 motility associated factor glycosyltransferase family protein [Sedimentisphaerales bacterium]